MVFRLMIPKGPDMGVCRELGPRVLMYVSTKLVKLY